MHWHATKDHIVHGLLLPHEPCGLLPGNVQGAALCHLPARVAAHSGFGAQSICAAYCSLYMLPHLSECCIPKGCATLASPPSMRTRFQR